MSRNTLLPPDEGGVRERERRLAWVLGAIVFAALLLRLLLGCAELLAAAPALSQLVGAVAAQRGRPLSTDEQAALDALVRALKAADAREHECKLNTEKAHVDELEAALARETVARAEALRVRVELAEALRALRAAGVDAGAP